MGIAFVSALFGLELAEVQIRTHLFEEHYIGLTKTSKPAVFEVASNIQFAVLKSNLETPTHAHNYERKIMDYRTVGIIGAGQMGSGIAQVFAQNGFEVMLSDVSTDVLQRGITSIRKNLERQIGRDDLATSESEATLSRINSTIDIEELAQSDLVIEAATENEEIKIQIFKSLVPHLSDHAILATNTSSISVTRLASHTGRPERFIGLHFMNPVPVMKLVELIRGLATNGATYQSMLQIVKAIGKTASISADYPGFIVNRILIPMINEAIYVLYEGVGSVSSIDHSMKLGANHPMGPLELADFIGLDTCVSIMNVLNDGFADPKYRPCPLLVKYVEAGWHGRKTGRGFYDYSSDIPQPTR